MRRRGRGAEGTEVEGPQLHVRHGDGEGAELRRQHLGEGRERRADGGFWGVEGGVDGGDDGGGEDDHFGRC